MNEIKGEFGIYSHLYSPSMTASQKCLLRKQATFREEKELSSVGSLAHLVYVNSILHTILE